MAEVSSSPEKTGPPARKRKSGVIVPHKARWHQRVGAFLVFVLLRALMVTVRCRLRSRSEFLAPNAPGPAIFCFWHNRLASCIKAYESHRKPHTSGKGMAALISASRDGGVSRGHSEMVRRAAGARISQPAWPAGVARTHNLGRARLRPDHHAGRSAGTVLPGSGRRDVAGAGDGFAGGAGGVQREMETAREKLGPVSNSAAFRTL